LEINLVNIITAFGGCFSVWFIVAGLASLFAPLFQSSVDYGDLFSGEVISGCAVMGIMFAFMFTISFLLIAVGIRVP
jgi:hypothetical protein